MQRVACAVIVGSGLQAYALHTADGYTSTTTECDAQAAGRKAREEDLRFVKAQIVFRHGARTPVFPVSSKNSAYALPWNVCANVNHPPGTNVQLFPDLPGAKFARLAITELDGNSPQPYSTIDARQFQTSLPGEGCRNGQLTEAGVLQSNALGKTLRRRYSSLVDLNTVKINARTSNVARCIATLSGVLGTLLPAERLHYTRSIHVKTTDTRMEYLYANKSSCPRAEYYLATGKATWESNPGKAAKELNAELVKRFSEQEAKDFLLDRKHFIRLNDWLTTMETNGIRNPWGFDAELRERIRIQAAAQVASYMAYKTSDEVEASKTAIGRFVEEILTTAQGDDNGHSLSVISGHDTTVIPLLVVLGLYNEDWPDYCACVCIETWVDARGHKVIKVLYENEVKLSLSLEEFQKLVKPAIAEIPWEEACMLSEEQFLITGASTGSPY